MRSNVELVIEEFMELGEGPCWDEQEQALYWVDITRKQIHCYFPGSRKKEIYLVEQMIGAIVKESATTVIGALKGGFYRIDLSNGSHTFLYGPEADQPDNRFNDGKCDAAGRFWAGTLNLHDEEKRGALYCYHLDGRCEKKRSGVSISNGIAWSLDQRTMYYIDTMSYQVVAFDYDLTQGAIENERTVIVFPADTGYPDGMTIDTEGKLWIAMWEGWAVLRYDPLSGQLLDKIELPVSQVSSCTFGGEKMDTLYITSASIGLEAEQRIKQPLAGGLFQVRTGMSGLPAHRFSL